jgi:hypothetical protein
MAVQSTCWSGCGATCVAREGCLWCCLSALSCLSLVDTVDACPHTHALTHPHPQDLLVSKALLVSACPHTHALTHPHAQESDKETQT